MRTGRLCACADGNPGTPGPTQRMRRTKQLPALKAAHAPCGHAILRMRNAGPTATPRCRACADLHKTAPRSAQRAAPPRPSVAHARGWRLGSRACALRSGAPPLGVPRRRSARPPPPPPPHPGGDRGHGRRPLCGRSTEGGAGPRPSAPRSAFFPRSVPPGRWAALSQRARRFHGSERRPLYPTLLGSVRRVRCDAVKALYVRRGALYGECSDRRVGGRAGRSRK